MYIWFFVNTARTINVCLQWSFDLKKRNFLKGYRNLFLSLLITSTEEIKVLWNIQIVNKENKKWNNSWRIWFRSLWPHFWYTFSWRMAMGLDEQQEPTPCSSSMRVGPLLLLYFYNSNFHATSSSQKSWLMRKLCLICFEDDNDNSTCIYKKVILEHLPTKTSTSTVISIPSTSFWLFLGNVPTCCSSNVFFNTCGA